MSPSTQLATKIPPLTPTQSPNPGDIYEVQAWVDQSNPAQGERVIVYGSLIKDGVRLGGIMMQATWQEASHEPGLPNCFVLVTYGRGVCVVEPGNYPPSAYVPITVSFDYGGNTYTGHTGFTPP